MLSQKSFEIPKLGQGTWRMERDERAACVRALRKGIELGATHVDTAELYGNGVVEQIVGEAIEGVRERVFLASKVQPDNAGYEGTLAACARSLKRLKTDWLDLYLLHWPGRHPLAETVRAFEQLVEQGKIRAWGVSNFETDDLLELEQVAGHGRTACNQVRYHLGDRGIEQFVLPFCEQRGIRVVGYSPFGAGPFVEEGSKGWRALQSVASAHGATIRQIALAFLVRKPLLFSIPKTSNERHVEENFGAPDLVLSAQEVEVIDRAFELT